MIKTNLNNLKTIDSQIKSAGKSMKKKKKPLDDYEERLSKAEEHMSDGTRNLRSKAKQVKGQRDPFAIVIPVVEEIVEFMKEDEKIVTFDYNFRNTLSSILDVGFQICQRTDSFLKISAAMEEASTALDKGTDEMIQIMGSILTDAAESDLLNLKINIKGQEEILSKAQQIDRYLENYSHEIEARISQTKGRLGMLGNQERALYAVFDRLVKEAGYVVEEMSKYKEKTEFRYLSQAGRFADAVGAYNKATATMTRRAAA
jgi:uncharacterized phage infection (PIP) family protein YhgE